MLVTHGRCQKWWWQAGNYTSHCGDCCQTFASLSLFDEHFDRPDDGGRPTCKDPTQMLFRKQPLDTESKHGGSPVWFSPASRQMVRAAHQEDE